MKIFRADLFYRINVIPMILPPLREKREDIKPLILYFTNIFRPNETISFTLEAMNALINYKWSGNIRELKNILK